MIPEFREDGWLPEGRWLAEWEEVQTRLEGQPGSSRRRVFVGLTAWRDAARGAGFVGRVILDGSFVSAKLEPGDFDLVFLYDEATQILLEQQPQFRILTDAAECQRRFGGDVWGIPPALPDFLRGEDMFDRTRESLPKGVLELKL